MPAVILVLACCLAGAQIGTQQLRLQDAAATAARSASRGESPAVVADQARQLVPGASVSRTDRGGLACVTLTLQQAAGPGLLAAVTLQASGCALAEAG